MYELTVNIHPYWDNDSVGKVKFTFTFPAEGLPQVSEVPQLSHSVIAYGGLCPFPEYSDLEISDVAGEVPYYTGDAVTPDNNIQFEGIYLKRSVSGTVTWSLIEYPRVLPEGYKSSPYYDFRAEPYGLNGVGLFSFILPALDPDTEMNVEYTWAMEDMPDGARGILNYGEGTVRKTLSIENTFLTMFNMGLMHCFEKDGFGVYWFTQPEFDVEGVSRKLLPIYKYEKEYFKDNDSDFYVFLRRDPFEKSGGGSAVPYAFISGYSAFGGMNEEMWFNVLIHEMTHTWPSMLDRVTGEGTWFCEGGTEYYCTVLPHEGGFIDAEQTAAYINEKAVDRYYKNEYRTCSASEIAEIQWQHRSAQEVPYGRGFVYIANVNAKLRKAGKAGIEDLVRQYNIMHSMPLQVWIDYVTENLGAEGYKDYLDMINGKLIIPEPDLFGQDFVTVQDEIELNGERVIGYHWEVKNNFDK